MVIRLKRGAEMEGERVPQYSANGPLITATSAGLESLFQSFSSQAEAAGSERAGKGGPRMPMQILHSPSVGKSEVAVFQGVRIDPGAAERLRD